MIFGKEDLRQEIYQDIKSIEEKNNIKIVYAAETGSISKGCQSFTSDYDTRFLFLHQNFPSEIYNPNECNLEDIKMLIYPEKQYYSDKYELRELTSYLHFLIHPSINGICKDCGMYFYLGYTFMAPYSWDPLGLKSKLVPLMNGIFYAPYLLTFHYYQIATYYADDTVILIKNYLRCIFSALCIEWALKFNNFPPCYIESLLVFSSNNKLSSYVKELLIYYRQESKNKKNTEIYVNTDLIIDTYIKEEQQVAYSRMHNLKMNDVLSGKCEEVVNKMYKIIGHSLNEEIVKGIND